MSDSFGEKIEKKALGIILTNDNVNGYTDKFSVLISFKKPLNSKIKRLF
jgi:hypothetical protein